MLKSFVVNSRAHRPLLEARALRNRLLVTLAPSKRAATAYCISPYKTGTTYIHNLFRQTCRSEHEPLHYETLKWMGHENFLRKRSSYLNLDFEASGFFAGKIDLLRQISPNAPILLIFREFDAWVESFINYFTELSCAVSYNYPLRIWFDRITIYPVDRFFHLSPEHQDAVLTSLWKYWLKAYEDAIGRDDVLIADLKSMDEDLPKIAEFLNLPAPAPGPDELKRIHNKKQKIDIQKHLDIEDVRKKTQELTSLLRHI